MRASSASRPPAPRASPRGKRCVDCGLCELRHFKSAGLRFWCLRERRALGWKAVLRRGCPRWQPQTLAEFRLY